MQLFFRSGRVLNESDLFDIDDDQAMFIQDFKMLILDKQKILLDQSLRDEEKKEKKLKTYYFSVVNRQIVNVWLLIVTDNILKQVLYKLYYLLLLGWKISI